MLLGSCAERGAWISGSGRETPKMMAHAALLYLYLHTVLTPGIAGLSLQLSREHDQLGHSADLDLRQPSHLYRYRRDTEDGTTADPEVSVGEGTTMSPGGTEDGGTYFTCNDDQDLCICFGCQSGINSSTACCTEKYADHLQHKVVVTLVNFTMDRYASGDFEDRWRHTIAYYFSRACYSARARCSGDTRYTNHYFGKSEVIVYQLQANATTDTFDIGLLVFYHETNVSVNGTLVTMKLIEKKAAIESALNVSIHSINGEVPESNLNITAVAVAGVIGFIFFIICIISARKACVDRKAIKERIKAKQVAKEKQGGKDGDEDNKHLVTEYEEVQAGNTVLPKAVSVKINGAAPKVPNGQPVETATESRHVAVQATIHKESTASPDQVTLHDKGLSNGQVKSAATTQTQTNATSKESLLNNVIVENNNTADVIVHSEDSTSDIVSKRKTFAKSYSVPAPNSQAGPPKSDLAPAVSPKGSGLLQLPPDANGSIPHGLPELTAADNETSAGEELKIPVVVGSPSKPATPTDGEESFMDTTMTTPKNSEPDIYSTAHESPVKVKAQQLTSQGYENPAYTKNLDSPD